jgi:hypothetical protein
LASGEQGWHNQFHYWHSTLPSHWWTIAPYSVPLSKDGQSWDQLWNS